MRDIENQTSHQHVFKDHKHNVEPFVGIIVGPYDIRMPTEESIISIIIVKIYFFLKNVDRLVSRNEQLRSKRTTYVCRPQGIGRWYYFRRSWKEIGKNRFHQMRTYFVVWPGRYLQGLWI